MRQGRGRFRRLAVCAVLTLLGPAAAAGANPVTYENARPGGSGWEISSAAGRYITGYASETSLVPGQTLHLHVAGPLGAAYRIELYRLGWYSGAGGRRITCAPGCAVSKRVVQSLSAGTPDPHTGLLRAGWPVSDRITIPRDAVSGYYEA